MNQFFIVGFFCCLLLFALSAAAFAVAAARRRRDNAEYAQKLSALEAEVSAAARLRESLRDELNAANVSLAVAQTRERAAAARVAELERVQAELLSRDTANQKLIAAAEQERKIMLENAAEAQERYAEMRKRMDADFKVLATEILDGAREKFTSEGGEKISSILAPLSQNIRDWRKRIDDIHDAQTRATAGVSTQIENLLKMNDQLSQEAEKLARALRSNNKVAGNWGEEILERIFESCGFIKDVHYRAQASFSDSTSKQSRLMPDFIIDLPNGRSIIVDSKMSLVDYEDYCAADDAEAKRACLEKFKKSARAHLREFAKKYNAIEGMAGFKLMFMPIERAYQLLVDSDRKLLADAYADNVIVVSPVSVMPVLKYAQIAYHNDAIAKNINELSRQGRFLCERIEKFLKRFAGVQDKINAVQKEYNEAKNALFDSPQSVANTARRFTELSLKSLNADLKPADKNLIGDDENE